MAYEATGDVTPSDVRVRSMVTFIRTQRSLGKTNAQIRAALEAKDVLPGLLPKSHPCASSIGWNLCTAAEIDQAFSLASEPLPAPVPKPPTEVPVTGGFPLPLSNPFVLAALGLGALILYRRFS